MRRRKTWFGITALVVALAVGGSGRCDDKEKGNGKPAGKAAKESAGKGTPKGTPKGAKETRQRLPRYYGKLGLSDTQREKIYGIQANYESDIDKLEKQLAGLKAKQEADCRKVLNADQKKQLTETVEAAKAKAAKEEEMEE